MQPAEWLANKGTCIMTSKILIQCIIIVSVISTLHANGATASAELALQKSKLTLNFARQDIRCIWKECVEETDLQVCK